MPFGQYLLDDIAEGKVKTRLNIFLVAYALDKKQREKLSQISKKTSSIWVWAAGYIDESGKKFSFDAMRETSGFKIEDAGDVELFVTPTEEGKKIGLKPFGQNKKISPRAGGRMRRRRYRARPLFKRQSGGRCAKKRRSVFRILRHGKRTPRTGDVCGGNVGNPHLHKIARQRIQKQELLFRLRNVGRQIRLRLEN